MITETALPGNNVQTPTTADTAAETQLGNEICDLWQARVSAHVSLHRNQEELKVIRANLAEKLHGLKLVLARRGCQGGWSKFLNSQRIPRATADWLATAHEKSLASALGNCVTEQFREPTEDIRSYVKGIWPRLSRVLKNREAVEVFVAELRHKADASFEAQAAAPDPIREMPPLGAVAQTIDYACMA
jgi:hypothetical protein